MNVSQIKKLKTLKNSIQTPLLLTLAVSVLATAGYMGMKYRALTLAEQLTHTSLPESLNSWNGVHRLVSVLDRKQMPSKLMRKLGPLRQMMPHFLL